MPLTQEQAIGKCVAAFSDLDPLYVADIGSQSGWLKAASDSDRNLYLSGPMGQASSVALGLALSRPDDLVVAFCGDGALAMNASSLITIRDQAPANLVLVVLSNDSYDFTAQLRTPSASLDWLQFLGGLNPGATFSIDDIESCRSEAGKRLLTIVANIASEDRKPPPLAMTPAAIKGRFIGGLTD